MIDLHLFHSTVSSSFSENILKLATCVGDVLITTSYYALNNGSDAGCGVHSVTLTGGIAQNGCNWQLGIGWMAIGY